MKHFFFVIVHCEADYLAPLKLGDHLDIHMYVEHIGRTSFTFCYNIYKKDGLEAGTAKTVHVAIDKETGKKVAIPSMLLEILKKHQASPPMPI